MIENGLNSIDNSNSIKVNNANLDIFSDIPLYGRENEASMLLDAYERCEKQCQVVWIHGTSGIGKSRLVQNCFRDKNNFCCGKFDFFPSSRPYSTIFKILSNVICLLIDDGCSGVRVRPDVALTLTKLIPEIDNVLIRERMEDDSFDQTSQFEVGNIGEWSFQKLKEAVKIFLEGACEALISNSSSPLILYVDDIQWADDNSADIIGHLLSSGASKHFLFIGSYRDDETINDSLLSMKNSTFQTDIIVTDIVLKNLTQCNLRKMVADMTDNQGDFSESLADSIFAQTHGNPLFTTFSLQYLYEKRIMKFSRSKGKWILENDAICLNLGESALDILMFSLLSLQPQTMETLKIASCLGSDVDLSLLGTVIQEFDLNLSPSEMKAVLNEAHSRNLVKMDSSGMFFSFTHDRIRELAYELVSSKQSHESIHLKIGRHILYQHPQYEGSEFDSQSIPAIDHLNRGRSLIHSMDEKKMLAQLNMDAVKNMIGASAFRSAQEYLEIVIELMGADPWNENYALTMNAHILLASSLFGNGSIDEALGCIHVITRNSKTHDDRMKAQILHLEVLSCNNQVEACIELSLQLLSELDLSKIPRKPGLKSILIYFFRVKRLLRNMKDDDILNLPECHDTRILNALRICKLMMKSISIVIKPLNL
jgi:predicted ATPase